MPQRSYPPHWPCHQRRLVNCDWMPAPYTSGQPSNPRRHPTCWASSQRSHILSSTPFHGAWTYAPLVYCTDAPFSAHLSIECIRRNRLCTGVTASAPGFGVTASAPVSDISVPTCTNWVWPPQRPVSVAQKNKPSTMLSSNVQSIDLAMECIAWQFLMTWQSNGCSKHLSQI